MDEIWWRKVYKALGVPYRKNRRLTCEIIDETMEELRKKLFS